MEPLTFERHIERLRASEDFKRNEMLFAIVLAVVAAVLLFRVGEVAKGIGQPEPLGMDYFRAVVRLFKDHTAGILPPLAALFYYWHMWIYYSQILVYGESSDAARRFTTITAAFVILSSSFVLPFTRLWPLAFAISTLALFMKSFQVWLSARGSPNHPFREPSVSWAWSSVIGLVILTVFGVFLLNEPDIGRISLGAIVIIAVFTVKYLWFYRKFKTGIIEKIRAHWEAEQKRAHPTRIDL